MKVVIIGGGASGLVAAIYAAKKNNQVTILERNSSCGKKLLMTGNGKCNYWNKDQNINHYHTENPEILKQIITPSNQKKVLEFFDSLGIVPKIKNGYYYPYSNQAISIQYALLLEAKLLNVEIINDFFVQNIEYKNNQFIINDEIIAEKLVLAPGSKAMPKTGTDGNGYQLAALFKHSIIKPLPSLVALKGNGKKLKNWAGIRVDACVSLYHDNKKIKEECGEIQLTDYGVSGICVFNLSNDVTKLLDQHKNVSLRIDFLPLIALNDFSSWIEKRNKLLYKRNVSELFDGVLNYKLVNFILDESNINPKSYWDDLNSKEKNLIVNKIKQFSLKITGTNSFDKAQVCKGGVPLVEINPKTMESVNVKGLYLVGELLDVNGDCGGYNLSFAWISGMLVGTSLGGEK